MHQVKENVEKLSAHQKRSALWSKCAAKIGKVAKCAVGVKSLRTTDLESVSNFSIFVPKT